MKHLFSLLLIALVVCSACSNDIALVNDVSANKITKQKETVAYPSSKPIKTRSLVGDNVGEWETWESLKLNSGKLVSLPWNDVVPTAIPIEIRNDIKYSAGWRLIAHTFTDNNVNENLNYLVFHNVYSGVLKVFYYLESSQMQNNGVWELIFEQPHSATAFDGKYATLATDRVKKNIYVVNITNEVNHSFTQGWNCFQTELAYDPNLKNASMQITAMNSNVANLTFAGDIESNTEGAIISTSMTNKLSGVMKGVAKLTGSSAEKYINKKIEMGAFNPKFKKVLNEGAKLANSLITSGVSSLLGSFIGGFDRQQQTSLSVQLTTQSTATYTGNVQFDAAGIIPPLSISLSKVDGELGAWSAKQFPKILVEPYAMYKGQSSFNESWPVYETSTRYIVPNISSLNINPDLLANAEKVQLVYDIYKTDSIVSNTHVGPSAGIAPTGRIEYSRTERLYDHLYSSDYGTIELEIPILDKDGNLWEHSGDRAPYEIFLANVPNGPKGAAPTFFLSPQQIVVMGIKITTKDGQTIVSTHTFKPVYDWDYGKYSSDKMYLQEYPYIPAEEL